MQPSFCSRWRTVTGTVWAMASLPFTETVISHLPAFTPVTLPESSTVATASSLLLQTRSPAVAAPVVDIFTAMAAVPPSSTARYVLSTLRSRMFSLVVAASDAALLCADVPCADATTPFPSGMILVPRSSEKNSSRTANPRIINITYNSTRMTPSRENLSQTLPLDCFAIMIPFSFSFALCFQIPCFFSKL